MHVPTVVASRALLLAAIIGDRGLVIGPRNLLLFRVTGWLLSSGLQDLAFVAPYACLEGAPPQLFEGRLHCPDHPPTQDAQLHAVIKERCKEYHIG